MVAIFVNGSKHILAPGPSTALFRPGARLTIGKWTWDVFIYEPPLAGGS